MLRSEAFRSDRGLGKVALAAFGLGVFMALHLALLLYAELMPLAEDATATLRWKCLEQWTLYALALGFFHLMEFLLTAAYRPATVSYECMSLELAKSLPLWRQFLT
jgi:protein-S-isoprenylcysteine O-methyltransferase